jgi:hypothetical protein
LVEMEVVEVALLLVEKGEGAGVEVVCQPS